MADSHFLEVGRKLHHSITNLINLEPTTLNNFLREI